jgi:hypothetical protein
VFGEGRIFSRTRKNEVGEVKGREVDVHGNV